MLSNQTVSKIINHFTECIKQKWDIHIVWKLIIPKRTPYIYFISICKHLKFGYNFRSQKNLEENS